MEKNHVQSSRLYSAAEVGKELNVTGRTVLNWEAQGIIEPAIRVGKVVRFDIAHVKGRLAAATGEAIRLKQANRSSDPIAPHDDPSSIPMTD